MKKCNDGFILHILETRRCIYIYIYIHMKLIVVIAQTQMSKPYTTQTKMIY